MKKCNLPVNLKQAQISMIILFLSLTTSLFGQDYPFARNFINGTIMFPDSTQQSGQLKWFPYPGEKLRFRENEKADIIKYTSEQLLGFTVDTLKFVSLSDFSVYASDYAILGKTTKIKHSFGQLLYSGRFNIYFIQFAAYNALAGGIQQYPNFLFEKKTDSGSIYAAYPLALRMRDKKYERTKNDLLLFFRDYPGIVEKIKAFKQEDNFFDMISLMKNLN
jgi:hypothetical protein